MNSNSSSNSDLSASEKDENAASISEKTEQESAAEGVAEMERRAVVEATATADAAYVPSHSVMNASSPQPLLEQVDGPALSTYQSAESVYMAKSVPIKLRDRLDVPIHVSVAGSIVEYTVETLSYDISFAITAQREDGQVIVKENSRVDSHVAPITGKFLVASVPCQLLFTFDNEYSWFREKVLTYTIKVTPPAIDTVISGRRRRAKSALRVVEQDKQSAEDRLARASTHRKSLLKTIQQLEKELAERKKSLEVVEKEENLLSARVSVRTSQIGELTKRLEQGWDDERDVRAEV